MSGPLAINSIFEYIDSLSVMVLSTAGSETASAGNGSLNASPDDGSAPDASSKRHESASGITVPDGRQSLVLRSTPVFFARKNNSFYFISVAKTVHARNISQNPYISAAVTKNYRNYRDIKGAQLFGPCREIEGLTEIARAALVYFSKFSDLKSFMQPDLIKSAIDIKWYELAAERLIYTDNTVRFGYKEEVEL